MNGYENSKNLKIKILLDKSVDNTVPFIAIYQGSYSGHKYFHISCFRQICLK